MTATLDQPRRLGRDVVAGGVATGSYYPAGHHHHASHELTQLVRQAKRVHDHDVYLAARLSEAIRRLWPGEYFDAVVTVPATTSLGDRPAGLRAATARALGIGDSGPLLYQTFRIDRYRAMTIDERRKTRPGRFAVYPARLDGARLLLIDDVVTSGTQAQQAMAVLRTAGAAAVRFVAIAASVG